MKSYLYLLLIALGGWAYIDAIIDICTGVGEWFHGVVFVFYTWILVNTRITFHTEKVEIAPPNKKTES